MTAASVIRARGAQVLPSHISATDNDEQCDAILGSSPEVSMNNELMEAVEDQRRKLMNVLGLTQALKVAGAAADGDESIHIDNLEGALEILQEAIADVVEGLEPIMLDRAIEAAREDEEA